MMESLAEVNAAFPWFFPLFVFIVGACVGSFLNVVIYRMPRGMSVVHPGSHCACGAPIAWYDNLPIVAWLLRRGRARCCGRRFSARYPAVEFLTAFLFLGAWLMHAPLVAVVAMIFVAWMIAPSFIDLDTMEIPDVFSIGGFGLGVVASILVPALHGFERSLWLLDSFRSVITGVQGALVGSGLILWVALIAETLLRKEAMGFGDVKLMGAIGAFCGWEGAVFALFGGAILGCAGFAVAMALGRSSLQAGQADPAAIKASTELVSDEEETSEGTRIPFGPALAAAAVLYLIWLHPWVDGYFSFIGSELF